MLPKSIIFFQEYNNEACMYRMYDNHEGSKIGLKLISSVQDIEYMEFLKHTYRKPSFVFILKGFRKKSQNYWIILIKG